MYRSLQQSKPGLLCYFLRQDNLTVLLFNQWHKYGCHWQTVCRPNKVVRDSLGQTGKCISAKEVGYSYLPTRTGSYHFVQDHILCLLTLPSVLSSPLGGGGTLQSLGGGVPLDTKTLTLYQTMINQTLQLHLDQPPKPPIPDKPFSLQNFITIIIQHMLTKPASLSLHAVTLKILDFTLLHSVFLYEQKATFFSSNQLISQ